MEIRPINYNNSHKQQKVSFGHGNPWADSTYSFKEKAFIAGTTAVGVAAGLAVLAKTAKGAKYSLNPKKMFKNFKQSYVFKAPYEEKEIITIGAGSCIGGLAGGYIIDKNKDNRKAKLQETLLQAANISFPAVLTIRFAKAGKYLGNRFLEKDKKAVTLRTQVPKATAALIGLFTGVYMSNFFANKINEFIFNKGKGRPVKLSDFSAHLDDFCMAAKQINETNPLIHSFTMAIPVALMVAGNEIGNKQAQ